MDANSSARKQLLPFDQIEVSDNQSLRRSRLILHVDSENVSRRAFAVMTAEQSRRIKLVERLKDKSFMMRKKQARFYEKLMDVMDSHFSILHPESRILLLWNLLLILSILFHLFEVPLSLFLTEQVYYSEKNTSAGIAINTITLIVFFMDMLVIRFNIAYYQKGKLIVSRISILKKYFKFQFWIDLVSTLILTIYIASNVPALIYLKFFFYIKVYTLVVVDRQVLHALELLRVIFAIYRLTRMIIFLWFLTTWAACIFFAIDYHFYLQKGFYYNQGQLWLTNTEAVGNLNLIQNFQWDVWYEYALYWAIQTSSTVGYGDLTPMNPPEVLYCNLVILLMTVLFAFFINSIWEIIGSVQQSSVEYSDSWKNLKVFLGESYLPNSLKQKLSNYLFEVWMDNDDEEIEQMISEKLSDDLRDEFYLESRAPFFRSVPIFYEVSRDILNPAFILKDLSYLITETKVAEGDLLYEQGNINPYLYFIKKGTLKVQKQGSSLGQQLSTRQILGVEQFFLEIPRTHYAEALQFSKVWQLSYHDFKSVIRKYSNAYEHYCELINRVKIEKQILSMKCQCWKCGSSFHFLRDCPILNSWRSFIGDLCELRMKGFEIKENERSVYTRSPLRSKKVIEHGEEIEKRFNHDEIEQVHQTLHYYKFFNI